MRVGRGVDRTQKMWVPNGSLGLLGTTRWAASPDAKRDMQVQGVGLEVAVALAPSDQKMPVMWSAADRASSAPTALATAASAVSAASAASAAA